MLKKQSKNMIGSWAFLIGLIIAIVMPFISTGGLGQGVVTTLVVIGLIIGLLNIADEETKPFLLSGTVLVIVSALGGGIIGDSVAKLGQILSSLLVLFVPATIVVAIKSVFSLAKN